MTEESRVPQRTDGFHRPHVQSAFTLSVQSVVWTVMSSSLAVTFGIRSNTAVLVAFGAIGIVDAIGSVALANHFHHGLHDDELSERLEKLAHRVVLLGLLVVGSSAIIGGVYRLRFPQTSDTSALEVALAATSLVALVVLSVRKQKAARRIDSAALLSDGHLSAMGAAQAAVTLAAIAITSSLGWHWADAVATVVVGGVASWLAVTTWRSERRQPIKRPLASALPSASLLVMAIVVLTDVLVGRRLILIGLLVTGPALAALSGRRRATAVSSVTAVVLAVMLGATNRIWLTVEHIIWISAVGLVGIVTTTLIAVLGTRIQPRQLPFS